MTTHYVSIPVLSGSPYWQDAVANFAALPTGQLVGEIRVTADTLNAYEWTGAAWTLAWAAGSVVGPGSVTDSAIALFDTTTGKLLKAATGTGFVKATAGVYGTEASIDLAADVGTSILPVANGGTNSAAALSNGRIMKSLSDAVVEAAAITAARALISDGAGIPTHSATTATELGYVSGVTSAIQTQFSGKEPSISSGTTAQYWRGDKFFVTLDSAALAVVTDGTAAATSHLGEVLSATTAANTTTGVGSTGVYGNAVSVSLTAGSWLVWGTAGFSENGATLTTGLQVGISASSSGSGISEFDTHLSNAMISSTSDALLPTPVVLVDISSTTTYYLNTKFWYTSGTPKHRGKIQARRVR